MAFSKVQGIAIAGIFLAACLVGCGNDSDDKNLVLPGTSQEEPSEELKDNYDLLQYLYFYSVKKNEVSSNIMDYFQKPYQENYGKSACTQEYGDVCYMYGTLSDPFTRYFDPNYATYIYQMVMEAEEDIGIGADLEYNKDSKSLVVTEIFAKSPAEKAGLNVNDTIFSIRGATPSTESAAFALIKGDEGEMLPLEVKRGDDTLAISVELSTYTVPTVKLTYRDSIPVIKITEFTGLTVSDSGTYGEFMQALRKTDGAKSTIIDLRGNPGGETVQCNSIAAELLSLGDTIIVDVQTNIDSIVQKGKTVYHQVFDTISYITTEEGYGKDRYYVFLADTMSASCSEILLSAITVNKKSPIVGLTSYGKGIGQRVFFTNRNGLAFVTGLESMDKQGNVYHKVGIVPDFETGDPDEQMAKAVEWAKEGSQKRVAGYGTSSTGHFAKARALTSPEKLPKDRKELMRLLGGNYSFIKR